MRLFKLLLAAGLLLLGPAKADDMWRPRPGDTYDPAIYCRWNRTGLPAEQQAICAKRDAATIARSNTPTTKAFLRAAVSAQRNITLASWAVMCGLRSDQWIRPIADSYQDYMRRTAARFQVGPEGLNAAELQSKEIAKQLQSNVTCKTLTHGAVLGELDSIRNYITGGYK